MKDVTCKPEICKISKTIVRKAKIINESGNKKVFDLLYE